jgi:hypothetical protein
VNKVDIFHFVHGNIYQTATEVRSDWEFQIKDVSELDKLRLSFALSQNDTLQISFQTGKQTIPCDLAAVFCSMFQHFAGGTFMGKFALSTQNGNKSRTIQLENVVFKDVPLAPLVRTYTPFAVEGTVAHLGIEQAVFGTETTYAKGHLQVINGALEAALFHRCIDNFKLTVYPQSILDSRAQMIPFTACSIHFCLQPEGIDFWADQIWRDAIMHYQEGNASLWAVYLPEIRRPVTYHELLSMFAPNDAPTVPLTQGSRAVLQVIPVGDGVGRFRR